MIDGTYKLDVNSPLGRQQGMATLRTQGDTVVADIDAPIIGKQHTEGRVDGNSFTASGSFKVLFVGKIDYSLHGSVEGDAIHIDIKSSKGDFSLEGTRV